MRSRTLVAVGAAVAVFAVTAIVIWLLDSDSDAGKAGAPPVVSTTPVGVSARVVSAATLQTIARAGARPIFWAGERNGARIEYTQASDGSTYVRYLTGSARAGDKRSSYVVVATYAQSDAYARVSKVAVEKHFGVEHLSGGGLAVTEPKSPRNVHIVYPKLPYQVEVYAPGPGQAQRIAHSGAVTPVG
jgi:hypothetical protein